MFSAEELVSLRGAGYEVETKQTPYDSTYAAKNISLPKNKQQIPRIIGWAGPARSGTTSLLFLLAGHQQVSKVFFQPIKTILRQGGPKFDLSDQTGIVCMKEVFRSCCPINDHDPVEVLLKAGVPPQNITWIAMLRDPLQTYASWTQHIAGSTPEDYAAAQEFTVKIYGTYKKMGLNVLPFAYDLLAYGESFIADLLLKKIGIEPFNNDLSFKNELIDKKMNYGQASDLSYFRMSVKPTLDKKKYIYTENDSTLTDKLTKKINALCADSYKDFYELSKRELGINLQDY